MIESFPIFSSPRRPRSALAAVSSLVALTSTLALTGLTSPAGAQPTDPGGAREQLKIGFSLKQQNKCVEALPHFEESLRLDPTTAKARLNMADCLETVGQLVRAAKEWASLRDQASEESLKEEAKKRLTAVEKRLPKLEVRIAGDRTGTLVRRDGVELRGLSLDVPLPVDPGAHTLVLEREGNEPSTSKVTLAEGETKVVTLTPGAARKAGAVPPAASASPALPAASGTAAPPASDAAAPSSGQGPGQGLGTQRIAGLAVGGAGVIALGVATFAFVSASGKQDDATALCKPTGCPASAFATHEDAKSLATIGNVAVIAGGVLLAGGATLFLTAKPSASAKTAQSAQSTKITAQAAPFVAPGSLGLSLQGSF